MAGLVPFNRRRSSLLDPVNTFNNMLDDFFGDSFVQNRNLMRDTFKVDVRENEKEYVIEAEMPGVSKDEIELDLDESRLTISVNRQETVNEETDNYIHRERRMSSTARSIHLADCKPEAINARLNDGVLFVTVEKREKQSGKQRISID